MAADAMEKALYSSYTQTGVNQRRNLTHVGDWNQLLTA
jgi:hypothetical protein